MNEEIRHAISPGEQVLWSGRPRQGLILRPSDGYAIPFSLLWCGFVVFWESSALRSPNAPAFFVLWGIPFVAVGIYLVIGRFFAEAMLSKTWYAVTPDRVVIVSGVLNIKVKSLNLKTLTDLSLSERKSGEGTITFGAQFARAQMFGVMPGWPGAEQYLSPRFDLIPNAKTV